MRILGSLVGLVLSMFLAPAMTRWVAGAPAPAAREATPSSLIDLLPSETIVAVEIRDLAKRWSEIRDIDAIADFQDRVLSGTGVEPDDLPRLAGERAVVAVVSGSDARSLVPVAVLRPPEFGGVLADLAIAAAAAKGGEPPFLFRRSRGAIWIGPAEFPDTLADVARGDGTSLSDTLRGREIERRLPPGGLARGWVNAVALRNHLRSLPVGTRPAAVEWISALVAAELEAVRALAFRRDVEDGGIVTDAIVLYDRSVLPAEVADVFNPEVDGPPIPRHLPPGVSLAAGFRLEPQTCVPWLRFAAGSDRRGPLRNLEFWLSEFEAWSGRDLERDLFGSLGAYGWLMAVEGTEGDPLQFVAILEARDAARAQETLLAFRSWLIEQVRGWSLGLALARVDEATLNGRTVHELRVATPLGNLDGPSFLATDRHLLLGSGTRALEAGLRVLEDEESWSRSAGDLEGVGPAHGYLWVDGSALASLGQAVLADAAPNESCCGFARSIPGLLARIDAGWVGFRYEEDAIRLHARARFLD